MKRIIMENMTHQITKLLNALKSIDVFEHHWLQSNLIDITQDPSDQIQVAVRRNYMPSFDTETAFAIC